TSPDSSPLTPPAFNTLSSLHPHELPLTSHSKSIYSLNALKPRTRRIPLNTGAPDSSHPIISPNSCKYCCPVLYYPAHCQLHYHLRPFIPQHMNYCSGACAKYTKRASGVGDRDSCGDCGISYRRCYERGRRMLDMQRLGERQPRLRKWYNHT
ncbi:hypothetical protein LSUB1_G000656, partial [Lachnellula subtilissima]